jgi:hypothetical protein
MTGLTHTAPASVLAFVSTLHIALMAMRQSRGVSPRWLLLPMLLVSAAWSVAPWVFSSWIGVALGLVGHIIWFAACEQRARRRPLAETIAATRAETIPHRAAPRARDFITVPVVAVHDDTPSIRTFRLARRRWPRSPPLRRYRLPDGCASRSSATHRSIRRPTAAAPRP